MSNQQKLSVQIRLNIQKEKQGLSPIYIRIYVDGRKAEVTTSYNLQRKHWNPRLQKTNTSCPNGAFINAYLDRARHEVQQYFIEAQAQGLKITSKELKNKFLGIEQTRVAKSLCDAFDYHNAKMEDKVKAELIAPKTLMRYKSTYNKVKAFMQEHYKIEDIHLKDLKLSFVTEFEHYLLIKQRLKGNTVAKYIKNMKRVIRVAISLDWLDRHPFDAFKCSYTSPERTILTKEEIHVIMNKKITVPRLEMVRDVFIFCCFTGFAYSDVYEFKQDSVSIGIDGGSWITILRKKTGTRESVPLLPTAMEIINKYKDHPICVTENKLLPVNSNQKYNAYLSELADICGINKKITTHIARHTFATTVTLANGVPIETVSKMLGHTRLATTQIYAKVIDQKISDDMRDLKSKLYAFEPMSLRKTN